MMAIEMTTDFWEHRTEKTFHKKNPTAHDLEEAVLALDGKSRTVVRLQSIENPSCYMLIYGPYQSQFGVNATNNNYDYFDLVNLQADDSAVSVFVGGQTGQFRRDHFVPQALALKAAHFFLAAERRKDGLPWYSQS